MSRKYANEKQCQVLLVGTSRFTSSARSILSPQQDLGFILSDSVSIELLISNAEPNLAVVNCDDLRGDATNAICVLVGVYPKLPIVVVSSGNIGRVAARVASVVIRPKLMRNELASAVNCCRDDFAMPLGFMDCNVRLGAHIAYLWKNEKELSKLAHFWTAAPNTRTFYLAIVPATESHPLQRALMATGLDVPKLVQKRKLAILQGDKADPKLFHEFRQVLMKGVRKSAFARAVGLTAGSQADGPIPKVRSFEKSLTKLLSKLPAVMICPYQISKSTASKTMECVLETHPLVIYKGKLHANPFSSVRGYSTRLIDEGNMIVR